MKEIHHFYDYQATEEDEFEEEEADQINVVKECLSLLEDNKSTLQREQVLATIIKVFEDRGVPFYNNKIVENCNVFLLLFNQCLYTIEKGSGSSEEVCMAARITGFLALSTAYLGHDVASTILYKSLPLIYKRLKLPFVIDSAKTVSLLNCLTIINFLVGVGSNEEELRDVIWRKVTKILGKEKGQALLAYGFFLTSVNRPATIDVQTISYLCSVLDCGESKVRAISAQVLGLIFETYVLTDDVREQVLYRVNYRLAVEESKSQWNVFKQVAEFLEHGCLPISKKKDTRKDELYVQTSSWAELIRLQFLKQFLGKNGFSEHVQKNALLQVVLKVSSPDEAPETNGNGNYIWLGKKTVQRKRFRVVNNKRMVLNKERTRSLEKGRMMKAAAVAGCYDLGF